MKRGSFSCPGGESGAACPIVKIEPTPALELDGAGNSSGTVTNQPFPGLSARRLEVVRRTPVEGGREDPDSRVCD